MTLKERILSVYEGCQPDRVPFMLDLSHWFYHRHRMPWDLGTTYEQPEWELLDYHKKHEIGFYLANNASFWSVSYPSDVEVTVNKSEDGKRITWTYRTPIGEISRERFWEEDCYSWAISHWGITTEQDLRVLAYALGSISFRPKWDHYRQWVDAVGESGVIYMSTGYSAMGFLLNYWMGVEATIYATIDWESTMSSTVESINSRLLELIDLLAESPAEIVIMGDNFSSDVQPPAFFSKWSRPYYREAVRRLHDAGKYVAVHIDGRLKGALAMIAETGADCADAVTPKPMGDLAPGECRQEAGPEFILSGGVAPNLWLPDIPLADFRQAVVNWLDLRRHSPRLIAAAGDQVPPGADEQRIWLMRDLVEEYGGL